MYSDEMAARRDKAVSGQVQILRAMFPMTELQIEAIRTCLTLTWIDGAIYELERMEVHEIGRR